MTSSDRVRVKVKVGSAEVEIECNRSVVEQTVKEVVTALKGSLGFIASPGVEMVQRPRKSARSRTCRDAVAMLYHEGWFSGERSLREVSEELSRRGYNYDSTAIAHVLLDLVRQNVLTRTGSARKYRYLQKRPPESQALAEDAGIGEVLQSSVAEV